LAFVSTAYYHQGPLREKDLEHLRKFQKKTQQSFMAIAFVQHFKVRKLFAHPKTKSIQK